MSLLSPKTFRQIALGGAKQILGTIAEERENGEEYLTTLAAARDDVNAEGKTIGDNYNKALRVMKSTGNTGFNNFLFTTMSIDKLAALSDLAPTSLDQQLKQLKFSYESLEDDVKASYEKGNFDEIAKSKYDTEIDELRTKKGLVNSNSMGENTVGALITSGVRKTQKTKEDKIIGQAIVPTLDIPEVDEGTGIYESIGKTAFAESRIKLMIDQDYIDGTLEDIIRNRLIAESRFDVSSQEIQALINAEYRKQVRAAERIFMAQGDDFLPEMPEDEITNENIDEIIG